jgi:molybdopterin molybdotransferase
VNAPSPALVLSYDDAAYLVLEHAGRLNEDRPRVEEVALLDGLGRVLAEPVAADRDQPPFPRSTRDGFACRASDLTSARPLRIAGQLRSGQVWSGPPIPPGEAVEIMTGAPVPDDLDCVVMIEHVSLNEGYMRLDGNRIWTTGENIVPRGAEAREGAVLLAPGTLIQPPHIAIAAACGHSTLKVFGRPRVAILATGDELVSLDHTPLRHQIRNSNSYSLAGQVIRAGGEPVILPVAPDQLSAIENSILQSRTYDLLLLSGGVSMGKYDFVEQALSNLGAEFFFTGARIQPGKPIVFGRMPVGDGYRYFFGLPGNPVSTMVTFALFVAPLLGALTGRISGSYGPDFRHGRIEAAVQAKPGLTRFLPARAIANIEGTRVRLQPWQGSGDIAATAESNCFVVIRDGRAMAAGDPVTLLHL